jgi:hypothetical protein
MGNLAYAKAILLLWLFTHFLWRHFYPLVITLPMNEPRKVKDNIEKCSVIKLTYRHTYDIPIGRMPVSKLNHGALFSIIFNFAKCGSFVARASRDDSVSKENFCDNFKFVRLLFLFMIEILQNCSRCLFYSEVSDFQKRPPSGVRNLHPEKLFSTVKLRTNNSRPTNSILYAQKSNKDKHERMGKSISAISSIRVGLILNFIFLLNDNCIF